jgi:hypothetical protein
VDATGERASEDVPEEDSLLHELRLRGLVPATGEDGMGAGATLVAAGWAVERRGSLMLTPAGRAAADERFCLVGREGHEHVQSAYDRFGPLNRTLLAICTDWQVRSGGVPNDHRDPVSDWAVIDRLVTLDEQTGPIVRSLGKQVVRFVPYRGRMRAARKRVEDGESDWLLSPRIDSYHTVWMQLHEDLLLGLGIQRGDEAVDDAGDGTVHG